MCTCYKTQLSDDIVISKPSNAKVVIAAILGLKVAIALFLDNSANVRWSVDLIAALFNPKWT